MLIEHATSIYSPATDKEEACEGCGEIFSKSGHAIGYENHSVLFCSLGCLEYYIKQQLAQAQEANKEAEHLKKKYIHYTKN